MKAKKTFMHILAILYLPIFLIGAFIVGISIVIRCIGLLLTLEIRLAKQEFQPIKRSFKKTIGI